MPIPDHLILTYQGAAVELCYRLGEQPYEDVHTPEGPRPRWTKYAAEMAFYALATSCMRQYGVMP